MNRAFVAGSNGPGDWDPLRYAEDDAIEIARCLSSKRCGFSIEMPERESSIADFRTLLYSVAESCKEQDTFICFFSGHGILELGELFLVWHATDVKRPLATAVPASAFAEAMKHCRARNKLLILDCCHAGAAIGGGFKDVSDVRVKEIIPSDNYLVLMASDRFNSARELDSLRGGFLSRQLSAALSDCYYSAVGSDRRLSVTDVKEWLEQQAVRHNRDNDPELAVTIPYLFGQHLGEFYFDVPTNEQWHPKELKFEGRDGQTEFVLLPFQCRVESEPMAIWIGKYPVLNSEYQHFIWGENMSCLRPPLGDCFEEGEWRSGFEPWLNESFDDPDQPVVCVSLDEACQYADWFLDRVRETSEGEILTGACIPTPGLWDMIAFGTEYPTRDPRTWLEGNVIVGTSNAPARVDRTGGRTNQLGISDIFGNVWEWCEYRSSDVDAVPSVVAMPPDAGRHAELRGGGFLDDLRLTPPFVRVPELADGNKTRHSDIGFRIALLSPTSRLPADVRNTVEAFGVYVSDRPKLFEERWTGLNRPWK